MSASTTEKTGEAFVEVKLSPDPGITLTFGGMIMHEELGRPFVLALTLSSGKAKSDTEKLLGSNVTVTMTDSDSSKTYFNGILTRAQFAGISGGVYSYHIEVRPYIWLLTRTQDCKIFQNMSVWDIISKVLKDNGFDAIQDKRSNQAGSSVLEYCVQYRESAFNFIVRLMEQFGLYYYFEHSDGEHKLVFADDPNSHVMTGDPIPFMFSQTEQRAVQDHVWECASDLTLRSGAHTARDYNFTTPAADLTAKSLKPGDHPHGKFEVYDYPGLYDVVADGTKFTDIRMQEHKAQMNVLSGHSNARRIRSGAKFKLKDSPDTALNQEYLIIRTEITITMTEGASDTRGALVDSHRVSFSAIPGTTPFRLDQITHKPMIRGPQTAKVVGEAGQEITTDQYGRIKVQFPWDRDGKNDQNSSCWIRVSQTSGGAGWGSMFIPRIGMEVVVVFLEGNPDRPLVTGIVYNATQTVPYALPDNKTRQTIKTNSSPGGGGFNEMRFEDKKGAEEIFVQAQYDYNKVVLNNNTHTVTKDDTTEIKEGNRKITVAKGNQDTTVSTGNHSTTVSAGDHKLDVTAGGSKTTTGQAVEVTAGTSIKLTATSSIEIVVGGSSIKIDASGVTINGAMVKGSASGAMTLDGGGAMTLKAGVIQIN